MTKLEQVEHAIAALDQQRPLLGDAVVEAALESLRAKRAALRAATATEEQKRKQVTVLFADVSGFTALAETLDAEEVTELINALWTRLDAAITAQDGRIDKHIGDGVMAVWGAAGVREDDPERALHAALAMQAALAAFREARGAWLAMRIGLNTGPVLLGEVGSTHEFTAMGDAVNLAARLEQAAPVGGILISHHTYRHVRGLFDVVPQAPLMVKGKGQPVRTYLVRGARPRAFRMATRGVEGVETRLIGREAEWHFLQAAYARVVEGGVARWLTIVGDAGVGKSRLLVELERWSEQRPGSVTLFKGRAAPAWQSVPYSIVRDMFADRFEILESDRAATALAKFRAGMAGYLAPERADLVGHWIGFDFSVSPAVPALTGTPEFASLANTYLTHYMRALAQRQPLVMFLEDLHWADDSSLDLMEHLAAAIPPAPLLLIGLARPAFFERRPTWGRGQSAMERLELGQLSRAASGVLVDEILQSVGVIPEPLRALIVDQAEGNPFYIEELIKMLFEEGVIAPGPDGRSAWHVSLERLKQVHVPPTLTGILQARLDSLPRPERESLQHAAVVGRLFWDAAVTELAEAEPQQVGAALDALRYRELIYGREGSAFAGTEEYLFKHALLRDVTYETVLLKRRRGYHAQVAQWLERHAGERLGEYAGLIADHLERAGQAAQAASYLRQAGEKALTTGAFREALGFFRRALALLPEETPERVRILIQAGEALMWLGDYAEARRQLEAGRVLAQSRNDNGDCVDALDHLGSLAQEQGDWPKARAHLELSLALARQCADRTRVANALRSLGWLDIDQGAYRAAGLRFTECQALYQALGDRLGLARALNGLGTVAVNLGEFDNAQALYQACLRLYREAGFRPKEAVALHNLGECSRMQGDYSAARQYFREALEIFREIDSRTSVALALGNLGHVAAATEDYPAASTAYCEALQIALSVKAIPYALDTLAGLAGVLGRTASPGRALELLGLISNHPALWSDTRQIVEQVLDRLRIQLPPDVIAAGLDRGRVLQLETVATELLAPAPGCLNRTDFTSD